MRRLDLVVGPNGSGKTTFVEQRLAPLLPGSVFVNADVIAKQRWPDSPEEHSYEAAQIAATIRDALIDQGESFIAETVFSHPSKLDLIDRAHRAGYVVVLHVVLVPVELSVARVAERVVEGGHRVPEEKIRSRFERVWPLVAAGLVARKIGFFLQQQQAQAGMRGGDFERGGETQDATTDDRQVIQGCHEISFEV